MTVVELHKLLGDAISEGHGSIPAFVMDTRNSCTDSVQSVDVKRACPDDNWEGDVAECSIDTRYLAIYIG